MATRRVHPAAIAAASDGSVLLNVASLLPAALHERLAILLGTTQPLFVGIQLGVAEAEGVVKRLDNAAAEAAAHLLGRPKRLRAAAKAQR